MGRKPQEIVKGQRFNKLRAVRELPKHTRTDGQTERQFRFKCDCGNYKDIRLSSVTNGTTKSCGCIVSESVSKRQFKHGNSIYLIGDKRLHTKWVNMIRRCYSPKNKNYSNYGARDIKVSKLWRGKGGYLRFSQWAKENNYKDGLELDRRNNDKNYSPGNCRFVTSKINSRNRRVVCRVRHPVTGKQIAFIDLFEEKPRSLTYQAAYARLKRGALLKSVLI